MPGSLIDRIVTVRQGAYLPHWTSRGAAYAVCFRLADSLPQGVVEAWRHERVVMIEEAGASPTIAQTERIRELFAERIEQYLDAGRGACGLRRPKIAEMVADTLRHFDGQRYQLIAWCLMPNHVHVVVQPLGNHTLSGILKSWKGFSGREANRLLHRQGAFWQPEYYDHLVRDAHDLEHAVRYVSENPVKARLGDWPWVWVGELANIDPERKSGTKWAKLQSRVGRPVPLKMTSFRKRHCQRESRVRRPVPLRRERSQKWHGSPDP